MIALSALLPAVPLALAGFFLDVACLLCGSGLAMLLVAAGLGIEAWVRDRREREATRRMLGSGFLVKLSGYQHGIDSDEVGISVSRNAADEEVRP